MRRSSVGEVPNRHQISPKRSRSNVSSSAQSSPRQNQIVKTNELSKPKIKKTASVPNSPVKGARIAKPVQRVPSSPKCTKSTPSIYKLSKDMLKSNAIQSNGFSSRIPSMSKIPTPTKSRIPTKLSTKTQNTRNEYNDEVLYISEDKIIQSDDRSSIQIMEENITNSSTFIEESILVQKESRESSQSMHISLSHDRMMNDIEFLPPPIPEEIMNSDSEFPAPPAPAELEKLSMEAEDQVINTEDPFITTPRTLRKANSLRQKVAARRIQRTWKHFYQEVKL